MIILFTGPTLAAADVPALPELRVCAPVAQGDVYRAARERPWGIGIIDGFFEHVPAVWHKEILWAMSEGVHVFGASSMGALRAAELADFGMVGVGRIYEGYRSGEYTADDEVALAHLAAEHGYRPVSEALVNMRATLGAAVVDQVCEPALADRLIALAKARFYPERTWPAMFADARSRGEDADALDCLESWISSCRVDQKRRDALLLVEVMRAARSERPTPKQVSFTFEHTDLWEHALPRMRDEQVAAHEPPSTGRVLDELRLAGDEQVYRLAMQGALVRALAEDTATRFGHVVPPALVEATAMEFRRTRGLYSAPAMKRWLDDQGLDADSFFALMTREALLRRIEAGAGPEIQRHLADQLRAMGCYGQLEARARAKAAAASEAAPELADEALWKWYFEDRMRTTVPADLGAYAERFGFEDARALLAAVRVEHRFAMRR